MLKVLLPKSSVWRGSVTPTLPRGYRMMAWIWGWSSAAGMTPVMSVAGAAGGPSTAAKMMPARALLRSGNVNVASDVLPPFVVYRASGGFGRMILTAVEPTGVAPYSLWPFIRPAGHGAAGTGDNRRARSS